jgi:hypothetical protein
MDIGHWTLDIGKWKMDVGLEAFEPSLSGFIFIFLTRGKSDALLLVEFLPTGPFRTHKNVKALAGLSQQKQNSP